MVGRQVIDVVLMTHRFYLTDGFLARDFNIVITPHLQWLFCHPHHIRQQMVSAVDLRTFQHNQVTTANINFISQCQSDRQTGLCLRQIAIKSHNPCHG
ncbi:Uncharacterised protein [Vibrio cholerae]|uniref:Uncharacterized protein n=1 Tax=Vibrio cholerae TaxID=666 RepID=A0A655ZWP0_VIBCL|nr:Uncharacterised protein [Vibrio cholerae]